METEKKLIQKRFLSYIGKGRGVSSREIFDDVSSGVSYATAKRMLQQLAEENLVYTSGNGKGRKYHLDENFQLVVPIDVDEYFSKEADEREIIEGFHFELFDRIEQSKSIFTTSELDYLNVLQKKHATRVAALTDWDYRREMERLAIDLSWKSSQIEGNTYTLLETEHLLKQKETAAGKTKDEAVMLLNHKEAIDFLLDHSDYVDRLSLKTIEDIHTILMKELGVPRNIRNHRVGITGTRYVPLENDFQIREAIERMCSVIEGRSNIFEKSLLLLVNLSYIQPFSDGNKRTARILSNALFIREGICPLSYRTVDSLAYKKAMLIYYEQNNLSAFKKIFMEQFEFAVETYF